MTKLFVRIFKYYQYFSVCSSNIFPFISIMLSYPYIHPRFMVGQVRWRSLLLQVDTIHSLLIIPKFYTIQCC